MAAKAAYEDARLPPAERSRLRDRYVARAAELLATAGKTGFFKVQANFENLRTDPALAYLRQQTLYTPRLEGLRRSGMPAPSPSKR